MRLFGVLILALSTAAGGAGPARAAEKATAPKDVEFSFDGPFGSYDFAAVQRGFQVYAQVCHSCHSLDLFAFRNLTDVGYSEDQAKAIAAEFAVTDGPNDQGDMFERPAGLPDYMPPPFENEQIARMANNGALPPDLSVIVDARAGGAAYLYSLLTGYGDAPEGTELRIGMYWNDYYSGNRIAMAPPLFDGMVSYQDGTEATAEQMARDVTHFLAWMSEPHMVARKRTGVSYMIFTAIFLALLYLSYRRVWQPIKRGESPWGERAG